MGFLRFTLQSWSHQRRPPIESKFAMRSVAIHIVQEHLHQTIPGIGVTPMNVIDAAVDQCIPRREPSLVHRVVRLDAQWPGLIGGQEIAELREALSAFPCFDPWKNADSVEFPHDQIPPGTHVAQIREAPRLQRLHEIALDSRIIGLVENYFGCRPYLDSIQAWWSISGNNEAEEAENFHRDNDSIRFLKLFLYATDVGPDNGPHVYVAGSHAEPLLTQRRRLSDAEVEQAFGRDRIRTMTGVAGDAFLEDTYGIHKGQLPVAGKRLLIQFRYSITETVFRSPLMVSSPLNAKATAATSLIHER